MLTQPWHNHPQSESQPSLPDHEVQNIAHDLNNDLNVASGYVELLVRNGAIQSQEHQFLEEVQTALRSARERVKKLQHH